MENHHVKAIPSNKKDATSGQLIVPTSNGEKKIINAVVFTSKQSRKISEAVDRVYAAKRKK